MENASLPQSVIVSENYARAREALAELLRSDGYRAVEADTESALSAIDANPDAAVLLLDFDMRNWKSIVDFARSRIPGIFVVGMAGTEPVPPRAELDQHNIHCCFRKPLSYSAISQAIRNGNPRQPSL